MTGRKRDQQRLPLAHRQELKRLPPPLRAPPLRDQRRKVGRLPEDPHPPRERVELVRAELVVLERVRPRGALRGPGRHHRRLVLPLLRLRCNFERPQIVLDKPRQ